MLRTFSLVLVLSFVLPSVAPAAVERSWTDPYFGKEWSLEPTGEELVVVFRPGTVESARAELLDARGWTASRPFSGEYGVGVFRTERAWDVDAEVARLERDPRIAGAAPAVVDQESFVKYYVPGQLTVQFDQSLSDEACRARIAARGSAVLEDYWTPGYYKIAVPAGGELFTEIRSWIQDPVVLFAEPIYMCYDDALAAPNDPFYPQQWAFDNPGTGSWSETADVGAEAAWDLTKGDPDVLIVVIDTGVDYTHEDLADRVIPQNGDDWDFTGAGTLPIDTSGHGTSCSGIAVATQNNAIGVSGICPECSLMPLKVSLSSGQNANRADAINYAASRRPDFTGLVISCSWRMSSGDFTAVEAAVENAWAGDCVLLFASGNENINGVNYPARYEGAIAVGASSPCDERKNPGSCDGETWWGSNYGPELEVVAPGVLMYTTDITGGGGYSSGQYMPSFNGTSSATPLAAGVAGLIYSINPNLTNVEVREILQQSSDDQVGPPNEDQAGRDIYFGFGRVNAARAVDMARIRESFEDDLEAGGGHWDTEIVSLGSRNSWHLSDRRNHTDGGQFSYRCGAVDQSPYSSRIDAALISPPVELTQPSALVLWHWMDADALDEETAKDGGRIELSTDGSTWFPVTPAGGYTHVWGDYPGQPFPVGTPVFSGTFDWTQTVVDLSPWLGEVVQVRFRFGTRHVLFPGEGGEGWYVDDVTIGPFEPSSAPVLDPSAGGLRVHGAWPNPTLGAASLRFELAAPARVRLDLIDVQGRVLVRHDLGSRAAGVHEFEILARDAAGRKLPSGTYFYRLSAGGATTVRSLRVLE